jgi:hypothetical protein
VSNSRGYGMAQRVHYDEMKQGRAVKARLTNGLVISVGDRVGVDRDGWRDKVGTYEGKDYAKKKLRIRFDECGGALLLCYASELSLIPVVGGEKRVEVQD